MGEIITNDFGGEIVPPEPLLQKVKRVSEYLENTSFDLVELKEMQDFILHLTRDMVILDIQSSTEKQWQEKPMYYKALLYRFQEFSSLPPTTFSPAA